MGNVISFPGTRPSGKTLIVERVGRRARVRMHPILSDRDRLVLESFDSVDVARAYAQRIHRTYPELYGRIDDRTGGAAC